MNIKICIEAEFLNLIINPPHAEGNKLLAAPKYFGGAMNVCILLLPARASVCPHNHRFLLLTGIFGLVKTQSFPHLASIVIRALSERDTHTSTIHIRYCWREVSPRKKNFEWRCGSFSCSGATCAVPEFLTRAVKVCQKDGTACLIIHWRLNRPRIRYCHV